MYKKQWRKKFTVDIRNQKDNGKDNCLNFTYDRIQHLPDAVKQFLVEYRYNNSESSLELRYDTEDHVTIVDQSARPASIKIAY